MAEAKIEQKVLTTPTFINGSLEPAGAIVSVNMDAFKDESGQPASDKNLSNLADIGDAPVLMPTEIAAIGPTGPFPTTPQVKPAGTVETSQGFVSGGAQLIAEGHPQAAEMVAAAEEMNAGVEEEAVTRLSDAPQGAGTAGSGTNGTETGALDEGKPVTGDNQPVADTALPGLSSMNKAELLAQAQAEGVSDVTEDNNMSEIKAKIEAARAAS